MKHTRSHNRRGSALVLPLILLALFFVVIFVVVPTVGTMAQSHARDKATTRVEVAKGAILMSLAHHTKSAFEEAAVNAPTVENGDYGITGTYAYLKAKDLAAVIKQKLDYQLSHGALTNSAGFPYAPITATDISIDYEQPVVCANPSDPTDLSPYTDKDRIILAAKPFLLRTPDSTQTDPYQFLNVAPAKHPFLNYKIRRYPFTVNLKYRQNGVLVTEKHRISVFQIPLSQFARFSSTDLQADAAGVSFGSGAKMMAFKSVSGNASATDKIIAAQVEGFETKAGELDIGKASAFNEGTVQTGNSRLGGRLAGTTKGDTWSLEAPDFFTPRDTYKPGMATAFGKADNDPQQFDSRPTDTVGKAAAKAYDANLLFEVISTPGQSSPVQLTVYDQGGQHKQTYEGRLIGQFDNEPPTFKVTTMEMDGGSPALAFQKTGSFPALPGHRQIIESNLVVWEPGTYSLIVGGATSEATITIDGGSEIPLDQAVIPVSFARGGISRIIISRNGCNGPLTLSLTPPVGTTNDLALSCFNPEVDPVDCGSFGIGTTSLGSFARWRPLTTDREMNATGQPCVALILNMNRHITDLPSFITLPTRPMIYIEGVQEHQNRYFLAKSKATGPDQFWYSHVIAEVRTMGQAYAAPNWTAQPLSGAVDPAITALGSVTVMSPNPIVISSVIDFGNVYCVSRGTEGPDENSVYFGINQASASNVIVRGVVAGKTAQIRSYFDRELPISQDYKAQGFDDADKMAPIYKTVVLLDDVYQR